MLELTSLLSSELKLFRVFSTPFVAILSIICELICFDKLV